MKTAATACCCGDDPDRFLVAARGRGDMKAARGERYGYCEQKPLRHPARRGRDRVRADRGGHVVPLALEEPDPDREHGQNTEVTSHRMAVGGGFSACSRASSAELAFMTG